MTVVTPAFSVFCSPAVSSQGLPRAREEGLVLAGGPALSFSCAARLGTGRLLCSLAGKGVCPVSTLPLVIGWRPLCAPREGVVGKNWGWPGSYLLCDCVSL